MAKAVETRNGLTMGHGKFGLNTNGTRMTVRKKTVHDGDTVIVDPDGNVNTRFLGIDAPEASFTLPNHPPTTFIDIKDSADWTAFLTNPFAATLPAFSPPLAAPLVADLQTRLGPTCAANHARHADAATEALMGLIEQDMTRYGKTNETYRFFLAFATDVIDRYGRFLGYVYEDLPKQLRPKPNLSYNERLLPNGLVTPYFIWPNIDPFRTHANLLDAVPVPGQPITGRRLDDSRQAVRDARAAHKGIFEIGDPLKLLPFELRYLARTFKRGNQEVRSGPDRWVINLAAGDDQLLPPPRYIEIPNLEDRLFVPAEYAPLFVHRGWRQV